MASSKEGKVGKFYMYGLILLPFVGWSVGTFIGASAGSIFPPVLVSCLGVAIYGMFIAIITPVARRDKAVAICVLISVALSCAFRYVPFLSVVPGRFCYYNLRGRRFDRCRRPVPRKCGKRGGRRR